MVKYTDSDIPDLSAAFMAEVSAAIDAVPSYMQGVLHENPVVVFPLMSDAFPELEGTDWEHKDAGYFPGVGHIVLSEYFIRRETGALEKNFRVSPNIYHESGHAIDLTVLGDGEYPQGYYSVQPDSPFLKAWQNDRRRLLDNPKLYQDLDKVFETFLKEAPFGVKETFAELWAHEHGFSTMVRRGISDMRPLWPQCSAVIKDIVQQMKAGVSSHIPSP